MNFFEKWMNKEDERLFGYQIVLYSGCYRILLPVFKGKVLLDFDDFII
jgi:hypothetical protein